jgi:amino acid transporter
MSEIAAAGYRRELKRALSLTDLVIFGLTSMSLIAPLGVFGFVYNTSDGMVPLVYVLGLVAMIFTALSYNTMAPAYPSAGSVYAYAKGGLGEGAGFLGGWALLLDYALVPAMMTVGGAIGLTVVAPNVPKQVWVILFVVIGLTINLLGIVVTARFNQLMMGALALLLAAFVVLALIAWHGGVNGAHATIKPVWDASKVTPSMLFGALSLAVLSFLGFDAVSTLAEEATGGGKAVGRAIVLSLVLASVLFVGEAWLASLFVLDLKSFPPGDDTANAIFRIAHIVGGEPFMLIWLYTNLVLAMPSLIASQTATARVVYSMARDGKVPRFLAQIDGRHVPGRAMLLHAAVVLLLALFLVDDLDLLISLINLGGLFGFLLLHASVINHFALKQRSPRWFMHLVVPMIGFAIIAYVIVNADMRAQITAAAWLLLGAAFHFVRRAGGKP